MSTTSKKRKIVVRAEGGDEDAKPFLKWAGGKRGIADQICALLPQDLAKRTYREPFVGGGAIFFHLQRHSPPKRVVLSDTLGDLITTYEIVKTKPDALLARLQLLRETHDPTQFYEVRRRFNEEPQAPPLERAAWLIYLNKTCYNGLFRTNRLGFFNVPIGRFTKPAIVDSRRIHAASLALRAGAVTLKRAPFDHLAEEAKKGDVVYLDPPYVPLSATASFAAYADGAFGPEDQERLADLFAKLSRRGCLLALSNSDTPEVRRLYKGFDLHRLEVGRSISAKSQSRKPVQELLVRNLDRYPA